MGRAVRVRHVRLTTFSHATEDPGKVVEALLNILPRSLRPSVKVLESALSGHYGNEIKVFGIELHGSDALESLKHVICSMRPTDRNVLMVSLGSRVGEVKSHLYLRLDKQEAYLGTVALRDGGDVIKLSTTIEGCRTLDDVKYFISELIKECK